MLGGFEKIVEERIRQAQARGEFRDLPGSGAPLPVQDDVHVPEDLRLAWKMLKNAGCLPPEVELKKEIRRTEELLAGMDDTAERYKTLQKLNFLVMKCNAARSGTLELDIPQRYLPDAARRLSPRGKSGDAHER
ncbi:MAG: molecular chaperone DnaJ [Desulfobacterales bacterium]|nr:MAG: molecular chaperone DnaJ [Desulfobacterales bacterium]